MDQYEKSLMTESVITDRNNMVFETQLRVNQETIP